ncbi:DUF6438 domain-containing protein [Tahibacter sp. UC22_41]|uniref:DUF6438 domain-containing protein n=1 Tax=Tahibacter sp. UC22_41 TaxID=3350178 RepID=UPI0036DE856E
MPDTSPSSLSLRRCAGIAIYLTVIIAGIAAVPALLADEARPARCREQRTLDERLAEYGKAFGRRSGKDEAWPADHDLLPFDTIVFERSPCFGDCPVYRMQLHSDGRAELVGTSRGDGGTFHSRIDTATFARLVQLGRRAQQTATRTEYLADWTDDYNATITLSGRAGRWRVSDYGEVAPIEVWALETLLHAQYERLEWTSE